MTAPLAIDVQGLVKTFGDKAAVRGVDIAMPEGKVWGFLGPNGSGKTTTIRMICGLLKVTKGHGTALGFDIRADSAQIKMRTGYMTQKFSFWSDLSIRENLEFVARLYQMRNLRQSVDETLESLGLENRQRQLAGALSGGWKQRLALAAVTMHKPKLLLLDEPTAGVDPQARRDFWNEIHRLSSAGMTVLVSTHYMDEAERCDRIVYLAHGLKIAEGTVAEIIEHSRLTTLRCEGEGVRDLAADLERRPALQHVAYFGSALHVSGRDREAMLQALNDSRASQLQSRNLQWSEVRPSLEDAFLALMAEAGSDAREHG